jgi:hypothetical protein
MRQGTKYDSNWVAVTSCSEADSNTLCPLSHVDPVAAPNDKYPGKISRHSDLCKNVSPRCCLVATQA